MSYQDLNAPMERPIIFTMVRAILAGTKTQTRRVVKPQPWDLTADVGGLLRDMKTGKPLRCPYGVTGDRLWVRETWVPTIPGSWRPLDRHEKMFHLYAYDPRYRADYPYGADDFNGRWRPSIHMPRWASRLTLEITGVRVQRVQEISPDDARAEGLPATIVDGTSRGQFMKLWDSINAHRGFSWQSNPWCWVIEFRRIVEYRGDGPTLLFTDD